MSSDCALPNKFGISVAVSRFKLLFGKRQRGWNIVYVTYELTRQHQNKVAEGAVRLFLPPLEFLRTSFSKELDKSELISDVFSPKLIQTNFFSCPQHEVNTF